MRSDRPNTDTNEDAPFKIDPSQLLIVLRERWLLITLGALTGLGLGLWNLISKVPLYSATAVLQIETPSRVLNFDAEAIPSPVTDGEIQLILETLQSRPLLLETARILKLEAGAPFFSTPLSTEEAASRLPGLFQARARRGTPLIGITARHANAEAASRLANGLGEALIAHSQSRRAHTFQSNLAFLTQEAESLKSRLQKSEEALQNFRETHHANSLEEKQDTVTAALKSEAANLAAARASRIRLETDVAEMEKLRETPEQLLTVASVAQHPSVVTHRSQIEELRSRVQTLRLRYTEKHPRVAELRQQLQEAQNALWRLVLQIPETLRSELQRAAATEQSFQLAVQDQERESMALNRQSIAYSVLARDVETDRSLYQAILKRMKESNIELGLPPGHLRLFESALTPMAPDPTKGPQRLLLGAFLGGFFSSSLALLQTLLQGSWRSISDLEAATELPVLASIPLLGASRKNPLPLLHPPSYSRNSELSREAFRCLRATLHSRRRNTRNRCLLFASALPRDGKTSCLMGYALSLAHQGQRTLLVDGDLRRGTLSEAMLRRPIHCGLSQVLAGDCSLEDAVTETPISALRLLPAGPPLPETTEELTQKRIGSLLLELMEEYEYVLIDSPPVLAASDALVLASAVDSICVVARYGTTPKKDFLRALQLLSDTGTPIEGIIFNAVSPFAIPAYPTEDFPRSKPVVST
jgi:succinoglycan biosynthesis transport protein ExoP